MRTWPPTSRYALEAKGSLAWTGEKLAFDGKLSSVGPTTAARLSLACRRPTVRGGLRRQRRAGREPAGRRQRQLQGRIVGQAGALARPPARSGTDDGRARAVDPGCGGRPSHAAPTWRRRWATIRWRAR